MKGTGLSWAAAAGFTLLALLLFPVGMTRGLGDTWESREESLAGVEKALVADRSLHLPTAPPGFPGPASYCGECHSLPPHPGTGVSPAFLNHHATLFDCLVCHWAAVSGAQPEPEWEGERLRQPLRPPAESGQDGIAALRQRVTGSQKCFDGGLGCSACHRSGGMDRLARPGLTPQARASLERLPDFFPLSGSAKWYFPQRLQTVAP